MQLNTYSGVVKSLSDNEVFVFGANLSGFHGAGSAGYASFGKFGNHWRSEGYGQWPDGTQGLWNVKGKTGPQVGTEGKSFGLVTVTRPGAKRSIAPDQMAANISNLYACCARNPQWTFYMAQSQHTGLNGYTGAEMASFFKAAGEIPSNLHFSEDFARLF